MKVWYVFLVLFLLCVFGIAYIVVFKDLSRDEEVTTFENVDSFTIDDGDSIAVVNGTYIKDVDTVTYYNGTLTVYRSSESGWVPAIFGLIMLSILFGIITLVLADNIGR